MTITSNVLRNKYQGNSLQTSFPYQFKVESKSQLSVSRISGNNVFPLVVDVDFTVTGVGNDAGGNVIYPISGSPLPVGQFLLIKPNVPYNQLMKLENQNTFPPKTVEKSMDYLCLQIKQLAEALERSIKVSDAYTENPDAFFAVIADAANQAAAAAASATAALNSANNSQASAVASAASAANAANVLLNALLKTGDVMTGRLGIVDGTVGSPSIYMADDTDTGFYSPANGQMAVVLDGVIRALFSANANILNGSLLIGDTTATTPVQNGFFHVKIAGSNAALGYFGTYDANGIMIEKNSADNSFRFWKGVIGSASLLFMIDTNGCILTGGQSAASGYSAYGDVTLPASGKIRALNTAKSWVNFNGSGGAVIRSSFNVSSVTRTALGEYNINFTNAMADNNYCGIAMGAGGNGLGGTTGWNVCERITNTPALVRTTSMFPITCAVATGSTLGDAFTCNVVIFGN